MHLCTMKFGPLACIHRTCRNLYTHYVYNGARYNISSMHKFKTNLTLANLTSYKIRTNICHGNIELSGARKTSWNGCAKGLQAKYNTSIGHAETQNESDTRKSNLIKDKNEHLQRQYRIERSSKIRQRLRKLSGMLTHISCAMTPGPVAVMPQAIG